MHVLVLGDSDTAGAYTGGASWPQLLESGLNKALAETVSVQSLPFSAVPINASEFAERKVREREPDVVVIVLGSFPFTARFTWLRVRQLVGKRAGEAYRHFEERFDRATRAESGAPGRANSTARWLVRHLIGAKAYSTREEITENYRLVLRALSRFEDVQVVAFAYPGIGAHARTGKGPALRRRFFADLERTAAEYHFTWVDGVAVFAGQDSEAMKLDELHYSPAGHAVLASALEAAIVAGRAPVAGSASNPSPRV